ncbi:DUF721 domain-containing protein [Raineyella fluvialis]|uniref:DUF721 domain-containing protein n=1 Tax=Raineyella fluvialis TaxID=2662261 RepID=A0A5Q2F8T2_9ACTN|nr:DciA family protein [Raineyella fluvialis]QGF23312.1 DUF721 domain-containing protein [Raineyella fluvialis]
MPPETTGSDESGEPTSVPDPDGLDLARRIARQVNAGTPAPQPAPRRRRRRPAEPLSSGARPDDRDPQPIGNVLRRMVEERGWRTDLDVHALMARWPDLIGPSNAAHCRPEAYEDGVLTVRTSSTAWAVQMRGIAPAVITRLNQQLGSEVVRRILVKGPDAPSWSHGRLRVKGRGPRDTYG